MTQVDHALAWRGLCVSPVSHCPVLARVQPWVHPRTPHPCTPQVAAARASTCGPLHRSTCA